ncbi:MAG: restriction endonuclease subunit S [Bacteroidales bacterium]|nr:restriction endonuclease subunit S [Bacteroidales bacterium]
MNDNLEQQAQALFKSWFVDFEPFKDGEFVESELGMIPKGWKVIELGEITTPINEKVKNRTDVKVMSPITTGKLVLSEDYFTKQVFSESIAKYIIVKPYDFAYNPARVNIGSLGMNCYDFDGCVSPVYVVFRCENEYQYFFDLLRQTQFFKEEIKSRAIGGVRQTLGYKDFSLIKVVYPPLEVIKGFNNIYKVLMLNKERNDTESSRLAELRDSLLPRLMSGELKVNDVKIDNI